MSAPDIPSSYHITQHFPDTIEMGTAISGGIKTELAGGVKTEMAGGIRTEMAGGMSITLLGSEKDPVAAKMRVAMMMENFPVLSKQDIIDLIETAKKMKTRIRMPVQLGFGISVFPFNLFGIDVVQFKICGEPQVIIDDYLPNAYERCAVDCEPCA